jgi:hypothetical protein
MKKFTDFLTESKKTYQFKIRIAGDLPEACEDRMETALKKFGVENMSSASKTPIVERPLDFPQLSNCEVYTWEVELAYPTTSHQLQEHLRSTCNIPLSNLIVRNPNEPQEDYQEASEETNYEAMLNSDYEEQTENQKMAPTNQVMDLLKELETARKERDHDPIDSVQKAPEAE